MTGDRADDMVLPYAIEPTLLRLYWMASQESAEDLADLLGLTLPTAPGWMLVWA